MSSVQTQDNAQAHDEHHGVGHIVPIRFLVAIGTALLVLTWLTVAVTKVDLGGEINIYVAMGIAVVKASLVALFFMHLAWDRPFNGVIFIASVIGVGLFIAFALIDMHDYRGDVREFNKIELNDGDSSAVTTKLAETQLQIEEARAAGPADDHDGESGEHDDDH